MTVRQMTPMQKQAFVASMEAQGVVVVERKNRFVLRLPNGEGMSIHFTLGDINGMMPSITKMRRAGVVHPEDPKAVVDLPPYITTGGVTPETLSALRDWYVKKDYPKSVFASQLFKELWPQNPVLPQRALFHAGFTPVAVKKGRERRAWIPPQEFLDLKPSAEPDVEIKDSVDVRLRTEPKPQPPAVHMPTPQEIANRARKVLEAPDVLPDAKPEPVVEKPKPMTEPKNGTFWRHTKIDQTVQVIDGTQTHRVVTKSIRSGYETSVPREEFERLYEQVDMTVPPLAERELVDIKYEPTPKAQLPRVPKVKEPIAVAGDVHIQEHEDGREFIDSEDSWLADLSQIPENMTVTDYLKVLASSGLAYEIRVWRKK